MDLTSVITRQWRLGRRFGRRLRRLPPARPSPVPLYSLGTAARIDRLRSWYAEKPAGHGQLTDAAWLPFFHDGRA